jgi:hypothetical protein
MTLFANVVEIQKDEGKDFDELIGRYGLMEGDAEVSGDCRSGRRLMFFLADEMETSEEFFPDSNGRTAKQSWNGCIVSFAVRPLVPGAVGGTEELASMNPDS